MNKNIAKYANFIDALSRKPGSNRAVCEGAMQAFNVLHDSQVRPCYECAGSNILMEGRVNDPNAPIFRAIENGEWDTTGDLEHDYPIFIESMRKSRHPGSLTFYDLEGYAEKNAKLYKVAGYDAGFAISGDGDIISVHNNTEYANVAPAMIKKAVELGGDHLDHFDFPRLNDVYGGAGFKEYEKYPWDDQYAPKDWDYEKDGRPAVKMRGLPSYIEKYNSQSA